MEMTYKTLDDAYKKEAPKFWNLAQYRLIDKDAAWDCVNMAFEKTLEYLKKHPKKKISGFILMRELNRLIQKSNRQIKMDAALAEWARSLLPQCGTRNGSKQLSDNIEHDYGSDSE